MLLAENSLLHPAGASPQGVLRTWGENRDTYNTRQIGIRAINEQQRKCSASIEYKTSIGEVLGGQAGMPQNQDHL